jgi:hypothetical protein
MKTLVKPWSLKFGSQKSPLASNSVFKKELDFSKMMVED